MGKPVANAIMNLPTLLFLLVIVALSIWWIFKSPAKNKQQEANLISELKSKASQGDLAAHMELGQLYFLGETIPRDEQEGLRWYFSAAEKGADEAQVIVGMAYAEGKISAQDYSKAFEWFRK